MRTYKKVYTCMISEIQTADYLNYLIDEIFSGDFGWSKVIDNYEKEIREVYDIFKEIFLEEDVSILLKKSKSSDVSEEEYLDFFDDKNIESSEKSIIELGYSSFSSYLEENILDDCFDLALEKTTHEQRRELNKIIRKISTSFFENRLSSLENKINNGIRI